MGHASGYFYLKSKENNHRQFFRWRALLALTLAAPLGLHAQAPLLTGTVVETGTGKPIPFATIELLARHLGVQATETGTFILNLPPSPNPTDSLRVASLGFTPRVLALPTTTPYRLELTALAVPLTEVVVRPSTTKPMRLGPEEDGDRFGFGGGTILSAERSSGWQVARKFTDAPVGIILSVRFYLKPNPNCGKSSVKTPFRIRIYAADGPNGAPGTDLLTASVLTAATKTGWHEVNLTTYQLLSQAGGFFVAMEWLYTTPEFGCDYTYHTPDKEKKTGHSYGQYLGGYLSFNQPTSWYLSAGYPWQPFRPISHFADKGNQSAAIQAIIQPN